jgi:hypothetical protein
MLPQMSMGATRRQAMAGAAAAGVAMPLAANALPGRMVAGNIPAPVVEIFDNRGCDVKKSNYQGPKAGGMEDDQCVKVSMQFIKVSEGTAAKKLIEFSGLKASSINVDQISTNQRLY